MGNEITKARKDNQVTGNVGLYYVCYRLSRMGWNAMPTARNARGIDIIAYNTDCSKMLGIQVKTLSKSAPVPLGNSLKNLMGDFVIVVAEVALGEPRAYILTPEEVKDRIHKGHKEGRVSFWLHVKKYDTEEYREAWDRIGEA